MKKIIITALVALVAGSLYADTLKTSMTMRDVRDPRLLRLILQDNFGLIETYFGQEGIGQARNLTLKGEAGESSAISVDVNATLTAGDKNQLLFPSGGGLKYKTDAGSKGSLADVLAVAKDGKITMANSAVLDNTSNSDELKITETKVLIDGAFEANAAAQIDGVITSGKTGSNGGLVVRETSAGATKFSVTGADGNTTVGGTLGVTGLSTLTGGIAAGTGANKFTVAGADGNTVIDGTLTVDKAANLTGGIAAGADNDKFTVAADSGNTVTVGTLKSTEDFTVGDDKLIVTASSGAVATEGAIHAEGAITSGKAAAGAGSLNVFPETGSRGKLVVTYAGHGTEDRNVTVNVAEHDHSGHAVLTVPNTSGDAAFVMTKADQTISGDKTFDGDVAINGDKIGIDTDNFTVGADDGNTVISGTFGAGGGDGTGLTVDANGDAGVKRDLAVAQDADITRNATVGGTLGVTGVATLTSQPVFVVTNAPGEATATLTNAPALNEAAAPIWIKVTVSGKNYVIPAFELDGQ